MRVITRGALQAYWRRRGREDAEQPLKAWYAEASKAAWKSPEDIKTKYRSASFVADNRSDVTVAVGCTGGAHRSVYFVEELALHFGRERRVLVRHRELSQA